MASKQLFDLERERSSLISHEKRIILERDEILKNLRNHLRHLDAQIVRLGGRARSDIVSDVVVGEIIPSVSPFPPKRRGKNRPKESTEIISKSPADSGTMKKRRGRPPKNRSGDNDGVFWTCDCGEQVAFDKGRCGNCHHWKGGKREVRWSKGGKLTADAYRTADVGKASNAIDVYKRISADSLSPLVASGIDADNETRSHIELIVGQIVSAVTLTAASSRGKGAKNLEQGRPDGSSSRKRKSDSKHSVLSGTNPSAMDRVSKDGIPIDPPKRKRGRPRKNPMEQGNKTDGRKGDIPMKQDHDVLTTQIQKEDQQNKERPAECHKGFTKEQALTKNDSGDTRIVVVQENQKMDYRNNKTAVEQIQDDFTRESHNGMCPRDTAEERIPSVSPLQPTGGAATEEIQKQDFHQIDLTAKRSQSNLREPIHGPVSV